MTRQEPMLMQSPLSKRVYVVTSYVDEGDGLFTARQKHDVTEQFDALAAMRRGECELEINTDATAVRCGACGYSLPKGADLGETRFCGGCGRKVKR